MSDWDEEIESETDAVKPGKTYAPANGRGTWGSGDYQSEQPPAFPSARSGRGIARGRGRDRPARLAQESNWRTSDNRVQNGGFYSENNRRNPGRGKGGFGPRAERNPRDTQEIEVREDNISDWTTFEMDIFNDRIGKLIGKGGQTIKEIQSTSGARVKILKEKASFRGTPIEICGPSAAVEKAKELVENINTPSAALYRDQGGPSEREIERPKIDWSMVVEESANYTKMKWSNARPIKKIFYEELDQICNLHPADVAEIRKSKNNITVQDMSEGGDDKNIPNPVLAFEDAFHNYPEILDTIYNANFTEPSPIQCQSWPVILSGLDMIGIAQTGTGKTLAFLLPAFIHIHGQKIPKEERNGPSCLVLSPTRELALQIEQEVRKFKYKGIKSVCIYGGGDRRQQINEVKKGVEIVIGTPGRLNDLLMNQILTVSDVTYLVLDEADRMLDMGFEPEIKKIILDIRPDRQTIMTSATWPPDVQRLADQYLKDPIKVNVGSLDLQACHSVTQLVEMCDASEKKEMVVDFINGMGPTDKLLIFVGKKVHVDDMGSDFALNGVGTDIGVQTIHGDRCQEDREQALEDFRLGDVRVLIATDVASRGLDIKDVTHVINYDFPRHIEEYVHRIGRTGRAGRSGTALSFITREDWAHAQKLIDIMTEANQEIPDSLIDMAQRYDSYRQKMAEERDEYRGGGGRGRGRGGRGGCFKCGQSGHRAKDCRGGDPMGRAFRPESVTAKSRDRNRNSGWGASEEFW